MERNVRICKKCLLRDMPEEETWQNLYEYIERLPREDKVETQVYEKRLSICRECEMLLAGMCRVCGCFVEMRAVMRVRSCPGIPSKWGKEF